MIRLLAAFLVVSLALNGAFAGWYLGVTPIKRMLWRAHLSTAAYAARPVVILGDSILVPLDPPEGTLNLAVSGATVAATMAKVLPSALAMAPRRIIIGLGINDLRAGRVPEDVAADLAGLVRTITAADPSTDIVLLAVLPLARAAGPRQAAEADNREITALNTRLAEEARAGAHGFLDHSGLFTVAGGLDDRLTYDGLHLNAAGLDILSRVLLSGAAAPTERGQQVEAFKSGRSHPVHLST
ncbi:GDSL-type esterase/lipase family protein [Acuticoccus yangtzensis]|uniref:GDSL-type esterase/lipase family protein n=1 Tax=Acuticoccus yangtzensis TaxID=1443441 RepID=UPI0009496170|nr:GDSL-type esterase/lipase family protein [Acuticoccus yangtzensis]